MTGANRMRCMAVGVVLTLPAGGALAETTRAPKRPQSRPAASRPAATRPAAPASKLPPTEEVTFVTEDNYVIAAAYTPPELQQGRAAPVVILLHMYKHDRAIWTPFLPHLHRAGFAVLAIDMRGHGGSVGPEPLGLADRVDRRDETLFREMHRDVEAGYQWLAERPDVDLARFALVGASVGCSVALDYASRDKSVDVVVSMTPGTGYLGIDSVSDVKKLEGRSLLFLAGEPEREAADRLANLSGGEVRIFPGGDEGQMALHGTRMFGRARNVEKIIIDFLTEGVGPPSDDLVVASIRGKVYYDSDTSHARRLKQSNIRLFSSPAEAEARGFRPPRSRSRSSRSADDDDGPPAGASEPFPSSPGR